MLGPLEAFLYLQPARPNPLPIGQGFSDVRDGCAEVCEQVGRGSSPGPVGAGHGEQRQWTGVDSLPCLLVRVQVREQSGGGRWGRDGVVSGLFQHCVSSM